jgi:hypothetical protein
MKLARTRLPRFGCSCSSILLGGTLAACGNAPEAEALSSHAQPIVRGEISPPGGSEDAVVLVRTAVQDEHLCSGTLVAPNLVLTVRHCVAYTGPEAFRCTVAGELVDNPNGGGELGADYPARSVEIYAGTTPRVEPIARGAKIVSSLSQNVCRNDIAFVVLDRPLDLPVAPVRIRQPTPRGELVKMVGYGSDGNMAIVLRDSPRRRREHEPILRIGPDSLEDGVTTTRPRTIVMGGPAACRGDSGGPLLAETTGAIVGVFSLLERADCLDPDIELFYTHTSPFEHLALEAFSAADAAPYFEGTGVLGDPCSENYQCKSGLCATPSEGEPVCGQTCEGSDCPDGFECKTSGDKALCFAATPDSGPCTDCVPPAPAASTDSGCGVSGRATASSAWAPVLAALGALIGRRRSSATPRRRSRSSVRGTAGFSTALVLTLLVVACGEDEIVLGLDGDISKAGSAGTRAAGGTAGTGATGGTGGSGGTGATAGSGGIDASPDTAADAPVDAGADGDSGDSSTSSCQPAGSAYALGLCGRLPQNQWTTLTTQIVPPYLSKLHFDCRVARIADDHPALPEFGNALIGWLLRFWGCNTPAVTNFGLVDAVSKLSAADAAVVIEHYMSLASVRLSLSSEEEREMRAALGCLAARAVTNPSTTQHEHSSCRDDSGADATSEAAEDGSQTDAAADGAGDDAGDSEAE